MIQKFEKRLYSFHQSLTQQFMKLFFVHISLVSLRKRRCVIDSKEPRKIRQEKLCEAFEQLSVEEEKNGKIKLYQAILEDVKDNYSHVEASKNLLYDKGKLLIQMSALILTVESAALYKIVSIKSGLILGIILVVSMLLSLMSLVMLLTFYDISFRRYSLAEENDAFLDEYRYLAKKIEEIVWATFQNKMANEFRARIYKASRRIVLVSIIVVSFGAIFALF